MPINLLSAVVTGIRVRQTGLLKIVQVPVKNRWGLLRNVKMLAVKMR